MSKPEGYSRGHGMAAHNEAMRDIRAQKDHDPDPESPTRVWQDRDLTPEGVRDSLTVILNTGGCRWARKGGCTMCGYVDETTRTVTADALRSQLERALEYETEQMDKPAPFVKLYSSGSVLDPQEVPPEVRTEIAETFADRERVLVESMPSYISREKLEPFTEREITVDVAIGLETASDRIRRDCINKAFDFHHFRKACETLQPIDVGVKAYLLLKPPFLTEAEAIEDMVESVRACAAIENCHTVSMNQTNVQRHTMVDDLYYRGGYRPPWLWSAAEVLKRTADTDTIVVSDPVGAGSDRGPHNCGECDDRVERAIKDFSLRQNPAVFEQVDCECLSTWEAVCERERGYSLPLER